MAGSEPYWASEDGDVVLHLGDCLDVLRTMDADSIDAIVTDPPAGIAFMDREWDDFRRARNPADAGRENVFGRTSARGPEYGRSDRGKFVDWLTERLEQAYRVLKPGGHALVWSIPRTSHWTAWAIEDAGFDVRDCVLHLFGSGFPKSLDVSKAIDKRREDKPSVMAVAAWLRERIEASGVTRRAIAEHFGIDPRGVDLWAPNPTDNSARQRVHTPTWEQWERLRDMLSLGPEMDAEVWRLNGRKGTPGEAWDQREVIHERTMTQGGETSLQMRMGDVREVQADLTAPATEDAARWEGWGTALKPGQEMWWLARKPLKGTVAASVLEFGTGALNIAACTVAHASEADLAASQAKNPGRADKVTSGTYGADRPQQSVNAAGRWPANVVFTHSAACDGRCAPDCPVGELDRQSGVTASRPFAWEARHSQQRTVMDAAAGGSVGHQMNSPLEVTRGYTDTGGASRFYPVFRYQAKAPASERPRLEDGTAHETVKPLGLMAWLVRLITPPGGTVLDLFAGSGPVAEACIIEGFRCVLIEQDPKSAALIRKRLSKPIQPVMFGFDEAS